MGGDPCQTRPFYASEGELRKTTMLSLMERLTKTGVPVTVLDIQYRMNPHISQLVSPNVVNDPSVIGRR